MKASPHFIAVLAQGIELLRVKYGADAVAACKPWQLFWAVSDSVSPGHRHNAKVDMPEDAAWAAEKAQLRDVHIETAIKTALKATT